MTLRRLEEHKKKRPNSALVLAACLLRARPRRALAARTAAAQRTVRQAKAPSSRIALTARVATFSD